MRFVVFALALASLALAAAFITPHTGHSVDRWLLAVGVPIAILAAGVSVWLTRNPFASVGVLPAVVTAALVGNFLPYQLGLWGLSVEDYASADQPGAVRLAFLLAWSILGTVALGLVIGLVTDAAHLVVNARLWPGTGDDSPRGLHPG